MKQIETDALTKAIEEMAAKKIKDFMANLERKIQATLDKMFYQVLGISEYGGIDHCNGREPVIAVVIKDMAKTEIEKIFKDKINIKEHLDMPLIKKAIDEEVRKEIQYGINRKVDQALEGEIQKYANTKLPAIVERLFAKMEVK